MTSLAFLARVLLAMLFALGGAAKLRDRAGTRETVAAFGVPRSLAPGLAIALPLAELAVAGALVPDATATWGALGALALLAAFTCAIAVSLARGRRPECRCLGRLYSRPAGKTTLARSCTLSAVAGFVAWAGFTDQESAAGWPGELNDVEAAWAAAAIAFALTLGLGAWLALAFHKRLRFLHRRLETLEAQLTESTIAVRPVTPVPAPPVTDAWPTEGLEPGAEAPAFALPSLAGANVDLDTLRAGRRPVILLFLDPGSPPCMALLAVAARWQREHGDRITYAVISRGDANPMLATGTGDAEVPVLFQRDREVAIAYRATHVPSAVKVGADGRIAGPGVAVGVTAIEALVSAAAAASWAMGPESTA